MRWFRPFGAVLPMLALALATPAAAPAQSVQPDAIAPSAGSDVPALARIAIVVMENKPAGGIIGNPAAPYLNSLALSYTYLDNYHAVAHPSLPNYLALAGGSTFGITSDCTRCYVANRNLADLLAEAGIAGKGYFEDMPHRCFTGSRGGYAQKHNPFIYFDDVRTDPARCQALAPYEELAGDVAAGALPAFLWITPNLCHDMHDCSVAEGDRWLAASLPRLLDSAAFDAAPSLLAVVWDEDDGSAGNRVPLILAGSAVRRGYVSHVAANHYSLLRTLEAAWSLPPLTSNDAAATPLSDVFAR